MGTGRSVEVKQSLKEGQNPSLRGLCERRENRGFATIRENRGSTPIGEAPDSVIGLTRVHYPSTVIEKRMWRVVEGMDRHGEDS